MEYLWFPDLENKHKTDESQFAYWTATVCLDSTSLLKETVAHYTREHTDVQCAMVDLKSSLYNKYLLRVW